jgi:predicted phage terminase large subunit-like protein
MEDVNDLMQLAETDEYTFVSQYQQDPIALTGGLILSEWFLRHTELPPLVWRGVYVDTNAGTVGDANDFTVFTHAGLGTDGKLYIIDVVRGKWDPEELLQTAIECWEKWKVTNPGQRAGLRHMLIEAKQAGQGLITTLRKRKRIPIKSQERGTGQNKLVRCLNSIPHIKSGMVSLPATMDSEGTHINEISYANGTYAGPTEWVSQAITEAALFKSDDSHKYDDVLDTWMDAIDDMLVNTTTSLRGML